MIVYRRPIGTDPWTSGIQVYSHKCKQHVEWQLRFCCLWTNQPQNRLIVLQAHEKVVLALPFLDKITCSGRCSVKNMYYFADNIVPEIKLSFDVRLPLTSKELLPHQILKHWSKQRFQNQAFKLSQKYSSAFCNVGLIFLSSAFRVLYGQFDPRSNNTTCKINARKPPSVDTFNPRVWTSLDD